MLNISWNTFTSFTNDKNATLLCSIAQDFALEQCVRLHTGGLNILDLLLTNNPSIGQIYC